MSKWFNALCDSGRYSAVEAVEYDDSNGWPEEADGGGGQGITLVHFSAQPEPFLKQNAP